jgi:phage terminase large subunit
VTARTANIIKEVRNYLWKKDKHTGEPLNVPVDACNHALDEARYAIRAYWVTDDCQRLSG